MDKQNGDDRETDREPQDGHKPANSAPDAVKDPNEKTDGKPGVPAQGDETDPGAG
ncbi:MULTISPECIES: hypothetical protein [Methylorubrum]|uniref:hypothetical protein n=1 Tax=Methylorubrum TaxID=2282523 RepID=UPI00209FCCDA|nr:MULTISPECIES: hypothetical protein [Methylorubrum]MCP1535110.1 hypothetical protein [Methylorubrum extorquens]MCY1645469.1 hypothetical protein [Methylorubrum sp. SL192]